MKKVLSLILALVMAMTALTGIALAEAPAATEEEFDLSELLGLLEGLSAEEGEEGGEEADLSAFLGMLGGLFGGEKESAEKSAAEAEEEEFNLSALMGMLGGLFGGEKESAEKSAAEEEAAVEYPKAESIEQFYGVWNLVKITFFGEEVPLTQGEETLSATLIINEKGIYFDKVDDTETELVFKDGVLTFGEEDFAVIHLTETGICFCLAGILDLDFVAAE